MVWIVKVMEMMWIMMMAMFCANLIKLAAASVVFVPISEIGNDTFH